MAEFSGGASGEWRTERRPNVVNGRKIEWQGVRAGINSTMETHL